MASRAAIDLPVPVVLASSSATRRELLGGLVRDFTVEPPRVDEGRVPVGSDPRERALALARAKAREVAARRPGALAIGADTLVCCRGELIGKPAGVEDAVRILRKLTRAAHSVVTAVWIVCPDGRERSVCVESVLRMRPMTDAQIRRYVADVGALNRAGAYAITPDDPHVERLEGSLSAVMGLPMDELAGLLRDLYPAGGGQG